MAKIKVTRVIVIEGEEWWVRNTLDDTKTAVNVDRPFKAGSGTITELSRTEETVHG